MKAKIKNILLKTIKEYYNPSKTGKVYIDGDYIKYKETHEYIHPTDPDRFDFSKVDFNEETMKTSGEVYWNHLGTGDNLVATEEEMDEWYSKLELVPIAKTKSEKIFWVPDKEHEGHWCFMCDGGLGWEWMNYESDWNYKSKNPWEFSELCSENFEKAGLFVEPYASWKYIVYKD
jgi:hypothetical protein